MRPKPEYGTIELRVLDTPLKPGYAAALACYARELCLEWADQPGRWPASASRELYIWNRFNAARDGVEASWIDPETGVVDADRAGDPRRPRTAEAPLARPRLRQGLRGDRTSA